MHLIFQSDSIFHKAMAAQYDLEPHRIGETRIEIPDAWFHIGHYSSHIGRNKASHAAQNFFFAHTSW